VTSDAPGPATRSGARGWCLWIVEALSTRTPADRSVPVSRYRIFRPVDNEHEVMLDLDLDRTADAGAFLETLRTKVWPSPDKAPAKVGAPTTRILQVVDVHEY